MSPPSPYSIAVVEDDSGLRSDLVDFLTLRSFAARGFESAEEFFQSWPATRFDVLLLDISLPGASGLEIAQKVREQADVGIVILTALDSNEDQVLGFDAGADVFLSKRSSLEVIEAACHSMLRRLFRKEDGSAVEKRGAWRMDARRWCLTAPNGGTVEVTHTEAQLIVALFERPGVPMSREALLTRLEKAVTLSSLRNLDNTVSRLRRKVMGACGLELPLRPSYGKGYTFTEECEVQA